MSRASFRSDHALRRWCAVRQYSDRRFHASLPQSVSHKLAWDNNVGRQGKFFILAPEFLVAVASSLQRHSPFRLQGCFLLHQLLVISPVTDGKLVYGLDAQLPRHSKARQRSV